MRLQFCEVKYCTNVDFGTNTGAFVTMYHAAVERDWVAWSAASLRGARLKPC